MTTAIVGQRFQVVIPLAERRKLGIKPKSEVWIEVQGDHLVVWPLSSARLRGIGRELSSKQDATNYVKEMRSEWGRRS